MKLNKVTNPEQLTQAIQKFSKQINRDVTLSTLQNINSGINQEKSHHYWNLSENSYCLCNVEMDNDGFRVYVAYQLYISPEERNWKNVRQLIRFLKFYATKHNLKRFYIVSSKLDNIKAYQRGIGKDFKPTYVTFCKEL